MQKLNFVHDDQNLYQKYYDATWPTDGVKHLPSVETTDLHVAYDVMVKMIAPFALPDQDLEQWLMQEREEWELIKFSELWLYWGEKEGPNFMINCHPEPSRHRHGYTQISHYPVNDTANCFYHIFLYTPNLMVLAHELAHGEMYIQSIPERHFCGVPLGNTASHGHTATFYATMWGIINYWLRKK